MVTEVTKGIKVTVSTKYMEEYSSPVQYHYVFAYKIQIENTSNVTVQLQRRHWYIIDSLARLKEVEGDGVVGQQPILEPGETHEYVSGCNLKTSIGKMYGTFQMNSIYENKSFDVKIPEFSLIAPFRNN